MDIRGHIHDIGVFAKSRAPLPVFAVYCKRLLCLLISRISGKSRHLSSQLVAPIDEHGTFTTKWFDGNAVEWMRIFESENLPGKPVSVLEIGSWEGRSTSFILQYLKEANVTAVDTWQGSDEHAGSSKVSQIENLFDANLARFRDRITKVKMKSHEYFCQKKPETLFDLIYVDGSHHADDVMMDALQSFAALKPGGIMIFDDYTWEFYKNMRHNPAFAINCFLKMKRGEYRIISVTYQICIRKLALPA